MDYNHCFCSGSDLLYVLFALLNKCRALFYQFPCMTKLSAISRWKDNQYQLDIDECSQKVLRILTQWIYVKLYHPFVLFWIYFSDRQDVYHWSTNFYNYRAQDNTSQTSRIFYSAERVKDVRTFSSMNSVTDFTNNLRVIVRRVDSSSGRCILLRKPFSFMVANPVTSKTF